MSNQFGGICCWPAGSDCVGAVDTEKRLWGTVGGFRTTRGREGVENVSIEDVEGEGPFAGVRPNAGGGGTADDDWEVRSVIGESEVLRIDPTTDSVCEGDIGGTGLSGGEGRRKVGGDDIEGGLMSNGMRYRPHMGLLGGSDGSETVCG